MKLKKLICFIAFLSILVACKTENETKDYHLKGTVFGTTYSITYLNATKNYQTSIDSLFEAINKSMSTYMSSSDINKINHGDSAVVVDDFFVEVFNKSKKIHGETNGFFDPTVGNLVNAYGFGPEKGKIIPSDSIISELMKDVGLEKVLLINGKIIKDKPTIYLDFNSIAKGYAVDVLGRFLDQKNITSYLIEIGGEITTKGLKNNGKPWIISIVDPSNTTSDTGFKTVEISNISMATSGNYLKFRITDDGKKYVHTVNPKTGLATESNLLSASVFTKTDCADADAYATAFMAMGFEETLKFLEGHLDIQVILVYVDKNQKISVYETFLAN